MLGMHSRFQKQIKHTFLEGSKIFRLYDMTCSQSEFKYTPGKQCWTSLKHFISFLYHCHIGHQGKKQLQISITQNSHKKSSREILQYKEMALLIHNL